MTTPSDTTYRLAICDDVAAFRRVLQYLFEVESDFEVVGEAANGREAIDLVKRMDVDVLLLDMAMPIMDGMEALPHIVEASPSTIVVMFSGFGSTERQEESQALGATAYIEKGMPPNAMVGAVRQACAAPTR